MHLCKNQAIDVFVINLDRSTARLEQASSALTQEKIFFERISAIDGRMLDDTEIKKIVSQKSGDYFQPLSPGEIGCFLSHVKALQLMIDRNIDIAIILEDDFSLSGQFRAQIQSLISDGSNLPDVVKICCSRRRGQTLKKLQDGSHIIRSTSAPITTGAAIWTLKGAKKFINSFHHIKRPIDVQLKHWWEFDLNVCWINPPLVQLRLIDTVSTIGNRKEMSLQSKIYKLIYRIRFFFLREWKYISHYGIKDWIRSFQSTERFD